ncbi:unnamed protein product [Brassica rapa]|uniref:Uncharacterized protein n=2 Tax=Brassica TaxID=3705 RepID=A0A8D9I118_BRACM|nr:unnamed protein product [Brassica napus]CAG7909616.1 unnamed protein product [Brassica rapa]
MYTTMNLQYFIQSKIKLTTSIFSIFVFVLHNSTKRYLEFF